MSRLIAFWSPSGAGSTTLLLNVAAAMGARRSNLAVADLNLTTPSLALAADLLPHDRPQSVCLSRLLPALESGRLTAEELSRHLLSGPTFVLLPGVLDVVAASNMTEAHVRRILELLLQRFDVVLADLTPALDSVACLPVLGLADRIVLTVGPDIASRFHTRRCLLPLRAMGLDDTQCLAVLNRAGAVSAAQVALDIDTPIRAAIPELRQLPAMADAGTIPYLSSSLHPALGRFRTAIDGLVTQLIQGGN